MSTAEKPKHVLCPACGHMGCEHHAAELEELRASNAALRERIRTLVADLEALVARNRRER